MQKDTPHRSIFPLIISLLIFSVIVAGVLSVFLFQHSLQQTQDLREKATTGDTQPLCPTLDSGLPICPKYALSNDFCTNGILLPSQKDQCGCDKIPECISLKCWNHVYAQNGNLSWPNGCRGVVSSTAMCTQVLTPLNSSEQAEYQKWVDAGSPAIAQCDANGVITRNTPAVSPSPSPSPSPTASASASPSPSPSTTSFASADFNQDGKVNLIDYSILAQDFFASHPANPATDLNHDGKVDLIDFSIFISQLHL